MQRSRRAAFDECRSWAAHWCQRWFLDEQGQDRLSVEGIDVGWATHVEAYAVLLDIALRSGGQPNGAGGGGLLGLLKRSGADRAMRSWGLRFATAFTKADRFVEGAPLLITEIPTPSMTNSAVIVAMALGPQARNVAVADPRALASWRHAGIHPSPLILTLAEQHVALGKARRALLEPTTRVLSDLPNMQLAGVDLRSIVNKRLGTMLRRSMPWLVAEATAVRKTIEIVKPPSVAIASDQHRIGRVVVQVSRQCGLPTVVLQHGLPQAEIGYVPVVATQVAAWSQGASDWFVARRTDPSRLTVTGNPQFDRLHTMDRNRERASVDRALRASPSLRLLAALSPDDPAINSRVLELILGSLRSMPHAVLVLKLHPAYRDWGFVQDVIRRHPQVSDRVRIQHREPLWPLLLWAQVTLVYRTTVAVESLAAGTPVLMVRPENAGAADASDSIEGELPSASDADHIASLATALGSVGNAPAAAHVPDPEYWVGPRDGRSALRVAALLLSPG